MMKPFPVIDPVATGQNILRLRKAHKLTVRDLQDWFGFEEPRAIYKWQTGQCLPSVDNLYALSALLEVPIDRILVPYQNPAGKLDKIMLHFKPCNANIDLYLKTKGCSSWVNS